VQFTAAAREAVPQCRLDLEMLDGLLDGRLLVCGLDVAEQDGRRPFEMVDVPSVLLARRSDGGDCFLVEAVSSRRLLALIRTRARADDPSVLWNCGP
jgi:hypothetical protein